MLDAIRRAAGGEGILPPDLLIEVIAALRQSGQSQVSSAWCPLKPYEIETLELVARGLDNPAIAEALGRSEQTIKNRLSRIYRKLDVHTRAAAVTRASEAGWL